jgi:hypothetical protein
MNTEKSETKNANGTRDRLCVITIVFHMSMEIAICNDFSSSSLSSHYGYITVTPLSFHSFGSKHNLCVLSDQVSGMKTVLRQIQFSLGITVKTLLSEERKIYSKRTTALSIGG